MSAVTAEHDHDDHHHDDHSHGPEKGWLRWVVTTNHKDIGTLYLLFALAMFFVGGTMAMIIRAELFEPVYGGRGTGGWLDALSTTRIANR